MSLIERWPGDVWIGEDGRRWVVESEAMAVSRSLAASNDEIERLREEWRKTDDGWIACQEQLQRAEDEWVRRYDSMKAQRDEAVNLLREARELLPHAAFAGWRHDKRNDLVERIDAAL